MTATTKAAMQAGSLSSTYIVAIEGYENLLTNWPGGATAITDAAVGSWRSSEWTSYLTGLFVELNNEQRIDPWKPFQTGGTCVLRVVGESGEALGIAMGRTSGGAETEMTATADRDDTSISVKRTADFAASGKAFIGNECIDYGGTSGGNTFTSVTRGCYSPFSGCDFDPLRFAQHHRVGASDPYATSSTPKVTQYRRVWEGAWVGVWEHRTSDAGSTMDTKEQAQLVFAGVIDEIMDDGSTGATVIRLKHVLQVVSEMALLTDQYRARIPAGMRLSVGTVISCIDQKNITTGVPATAIANVLTVVTGAPASVNEIQEGFKTADEIVAALNAWLASELAAARLLCSSSLEIVGGIVHTYNQFVGAVNDNHTSCYVTTGGDKIGRFLGNDNDFELWNTVPYAAGIVNRTFPSPPAVHPWFAANTVTTVDVADEIGTFIDQSGYVPAFLSQYDNGSDPVGFFLLDGKSLIAGRIDSGQIVDGQLVLDWRQQLSGGGPVFGGTHVDGVEIVQVAILGASWARMLRALFGSTGTDSYATAAYDHLPYGLGLNIPPDLLQTATTESGQDFWSSVVNMPANSVDTTIWITRPSTLEEILAVDCVLRTSYLVFRDGVLKFATWQTPVAGLATMTLTDANKAEPEDHKQSQRPTMVRDGSFAKPSVEVKYDYDPIGNSFGRTFTFIDRDAVDGRNGQAALLTLQAKNFGTGQDADDAFATIAPEFVSRWIPLMSRPIHRISRTIDQTLYEGRVPSEIVIFTDAFSRDPATGVRGVTARPGMVLRHWYTPGGFVPVADGPPSIEPQHGEVEILVIPDNRSTVWSPAAEVDDTYSSAGFTNGYKAAGPTLRCKANSHSEASEAVDASHFAANDEILITEIDPVGAPTQWSRTVLSVSSSEITLTSALSAPSFDTALKYRITSVVYSSARDEQETDAYQADDATAMVENIAPPYQYGLQNVGIAATDLAHTELAELDPTGVSAGDGVPFDTGYHLGMVKTVNNLMDHKTAHQGPSLTASAMSWTSTGSPTYVLVELKRRYFGAGKLGLVRRLLAVAAWFRSSSGASASVRVTLSPNKPTQATDSSATWTLPYSQVVFTTTSTTWATSAEDYLDLRYLDSHGRCWIGIEVAGVAETRGLAQCIEKERT